MSVVTRTNLATNPSAGTAATNYAAVPGTGGTAAVVWNSGAGYLGIPGFPRVTWSVATTAISGGISYTAAGLAAAIQYATQIWVRCSKAQTVNLKADFRNASNTIVNTATGVNVTLVPNVWTQLTVDGASGAAVTNAVFTVQAVTGGSNWASGDWLDGEAILIEAVTAQRTNLCPNPSLETDATGWSVASGGAGTVSGALATSGGYIGPNFYRATATTGYTGMTNPGWINAATTALTAGATYTFSAYVRTSAAHSIAFDLVVTVPTTVEYYGTYTAVAANTWTRISATWTIPAGNTGAVQPRLRMNTTDANMAINETFDVDAVLIEQTTFLGNYFDGSTAATSAGRYAWAGASNASVSVQIQPLGSYFDGGSVNANSVMYAWTGTANASTSTAKSYTPAIALVARPTFDPCPRVEVTITDVTPTDNIVNVWRTADGKRQAVRGARKFTVNGSNFIVDYEAPLGRSVAYDVEVVSGLNYGAGVSQQTVTVNAACGCIQDPLVPSSATPLYGDIGPNGEPALRGQALRDFEYSAGVNLVEILGSPEPVALIGQRLIAGNVDFSVVTAAAQQTTNLRNLLMQAGVILVRPVQPWGSALPGLCYIAAKTPVESPADTYWGGSVTNWTIKTPLVAAPAMNVLVPIWTYGTVAALWASYQQAQTALAAKTYLDVLKSPSGI